MQPKSEVFNIDCLEYMRGLPDNAFDLVVADPPYGDAGTGTIGGATVRRTVRPLQGKHIKLDSTSKKDRMYKYRKVAPPHNKDNATTQPEECSSDTKGPG